MTIRALHLAGDNSEQFMQVQIKNVSINEFHEFWLSNQRHSNGWTS